jgi:undecaprenyl-diphosphatase
MDWTVFHALNDLLTGHSTIGDGVADFSQWSAVLLGVATLALWLFDAPGAVPRFKRACVGALLSAGLALLANQVIADLWTRARPSDAHPGAAHLWFVPASTDPSFPSDHASAAFAIAVAVLLVSRRAGVVFLLAGAAIAFSRVLVGLHYPGDLVAGLAVGAVCAGIVHVVARPVVDLVVRLASRVTDPLLAPVWRAVRGRAAHRV